MIALITILLLLLLIRRLLAAPVAGPRPPRGPRRAEVIYINCCYCYGHYHYYHYHYHYYYYYYYYPPRARARAERGLRPRVRSLDAVRRTTLFCIQIRFYMNNDVCLAKFCMTSDFGRLPTNDLLIRMTKYDKVRQTILLSISV